MVTLKKNMNGNITIEAAFVMPMILFSIVALLFLAFYLHDICKVQGMVDKTLHKAVFRVKHEADIETAEVFYNQINDRSIFYTLLGSMGEEQIEIRQYLQKELENGIFITDIIGIDVEIGKVNIKITVYTDTSMLLPGFIHSHTMHKVVEGRCSIHNPAETIRIIENVIG